MCVTRDDFLRMTEDQATAASAPAHVDLVGAPASQPASAEADDMGTATSISSAEDLPAFDARTSGQAGNEPPTITINGNNPATVTEGATYADLGAQITGPTADLNLGIHLYVDNAPTDTVQLDTTIPGQHTIDYVATDNPDTPIAGTGFSALIAPFPRATHLSFGETDRCLNGNTARSI